MKKITCTLNLLLTLFTGVSYAQEPLPDGSTAPDFTFTDMKGVSHTLYTYLNQGKYVALDVSATWCGPCWQYHSQIKTLEDLYKKHDEPGDKTWKVLFIEGDSKTNDACMTNASGCTGGSQGDWLNGTEYPMCNPPAGAALTSFITGYQIPFYPTLYLICPDKKVYSKALNDQNAPWPLVLDWENEAKKCGSVGIDNLDDKNPLTIYPNLATDKVGLYFNLNNNGAIKLQVVNSIGQTVDTKNFGVLNAGDQSLYYSTESLQKGIYFFIVDSPGNRSVAKKVVIQ